AEERRVTRLVLACSEKAGLGTLDTFPPFDAAVREQGGTASTAVGIRHRAAKNVRQTYSEPCWRPERTLRDKAFQIVPSARDVLGEPQLRLIATELVKSIWSYLSTDWMHCGSLGAG